jgi:hypothetical protein
MEEFPMKCIKHIGGHHVNEPYRKVSDQVAAELVAKGLWAYCGKQIWKKMVRDAKPVIEEPKAEVVVEGTEEKPKKPKGNPKGKAAKKQKEEIHV